MPRLPTQEYELVGPPEFDERDNITLRYFTRHWLLKDPTAASGLSGIGFKSPEDEEQWRQGWENKARAEVAEREREFTRIGGTTADGAALYLRILRQVMRKGLGAEAEGNIFRAVTYLPGDRSAFRPYVLARLTHPKNAVAQPAVTLLAHVCRPEDAAMAAGLLRFNEFDETVERRDIGYFLPVLDILTKYGTLAEADALDRARANYLMCNYPQFWAGAEACVTAIRRLHGLPERLPAPRRD